MFILKQIEFDSDRFHNEVHFELDCFHTGSLLADILQRDDRFIKDRY